MPNDMSNSSNDNNSTTKKSTNSNGSNSKCNSDNNSNNSQNNKSKLCCFGYVDYIVLASTLAIALAEELVEDDLEILSTFFAVLSDELALIAAVKDCDDGDDDEIFVPPVADVAMTRLKNDSRTYNKNKTRIKKIKRKIKKK